MSTARAAKTVGSGGGGSGGDGSGIIRRPTATWTASDRTIPISIHMPTTGCKAADSPHRMPGPIHRSGRCARGRRSMDSQRPAAARASPQAATLLSNPPSTHSPDRFPVRVMRQNTAADAGMANPFSPNARARIVHPAATTREETMRPPTAMAGRDHNRVHEPTAAKKTAWAGGDCRKKSREHHCGSQAARVQQR